MAEPQKKMARRGWPSGCAKDGGDEVVGEDGGDLNWLLKFGPRPWRSGCWILAAQLDSEPSSRIALVTHVYHEEACSRVASGESSNPSE